MQRNNNTGSIVITIERVREMLQIPAPDIALEEWISLAYDYLTLRDRLTFLEERLEQLEDKLNDKRYKTSKMDH